MRFTTYLISLGKKDQKRRSKMGMVTDIERLGEDIITSYNVRVKTIGKLVGDTHKMLKEFHADHKKMAANLRQSLDKGEIERVKDFKAMMGDVRKFVEDMAEETANLIIEIQKEQRDRNTEVADLIEKFTKDHEFMVNELRKSLAEGETDRLQDFKSMMGGVQRYVADVIEKSERLTKEIQTKQAERREEVLDLLREFKVEREQMAANWHKLLETMYRRRGGEMPVKAAGEVKTFAEAKTSEEVKPPGESVKGKGVKRGGKKKSRFKKVFA
jgi:hypothetical protein